MHNNQREPVHEFKFHVMVEDEAIGPYALSSQALVVIKDKFETTQSRVPFLACAQQAQIFEPNSPCRRICAQPRFVEWDDKSLQHKSDHMNTLFCSNPIWIMGQLSL
ncbi:unnamed protein product [Protopolystoma xenopodis]|uniref:Uncharacterized protein n=1 Tax=Protopolystoma xenopodis TaxID=117903 RepID=A0A448XFA6_9PLAT|nr:unnamed protein product [Protopolystoma xenopodis]